MTFPKRLFPLFILIASLVISSCGSEKLCSGLNPEIGKYNTSKRLNKGGKSLKSKPERESLRRRKKQVKKKKGGFSAKGRYGGGIQIFGGGLRGSGSISGGGSANVQQKY